MAQLVNGRNPVFKGRKFDELDDEEKFRLIESSGVRKALEMAANADKGEVPRGVPTSIGNQAKRIALKLMNNEELTEEEDLFLVEHEDAINKELE